MCLFCVHFLRRLLRAEIECLAKRYLYVCSSASQTQFLEFFRVLFYMMFSFFRFRSDFSTLVTDVGIQSFRPNLSFKYVCIYNLHSEHLIFHEILLFLLFMRFAVFFYVLQLNFWHSWKKSEEVFWFLYLNFLCIFKCFLRLPAIFYIKKRMLVSVF